MQDVMKPLIGISCCTKQFGAFGMPNHAASNTYVHAVDRVVGGVPVLIPANGEAVDVATLLGHLNGLILTGSRSNVQPRLYGGPPHTEGTPEDEMRDAVTVKLIRAAVAAGTPVLAICRGLQEFNVALGGSLHQRLQDLPGRMDHSTPMQANPRVRTGKSHCVRVAPGSWLYGLAGAPEVSVNSLHNQGIDRLAPSLVVEATAPDGTIEAVRAPAAPGFAIGVQWHPEYDWESDALSRRIFASFGEAVAAHAAGAARWSPPPRLAAVAD
jgi:putative glutamine amidotransferase